MQQYIITKLWLNGGEANKKIWDSLEHNGVLFPPEYKPINIPLIYDNKEIILNPLAEEAATFYAKFLETEYIKNSRFNRNFWKDFKKLIKPDLNIKEFDKCNFKLIKKYLDFEREKRLSLSKKEKDDIKMNKERIEEKFKYALVNGNKELVGNFRIEPPGIFLGRGCHPKIGKIKKRIYPEDITINIGRNSKVPDTGMPGHNWGNIVHLNTSIWLASWKENVLGKTKYVWLSDKSSFKSKSDLDKFELARKLKRKITEIRKINNENLLSGDIKKKQLASILYFIDKLALRVGNEKGRDQADTVGVSSLRIEHLIILDNNKIKLDFLGKDSIRYVKKFEINVIVYNNLKEFIQNKHKKDQLFDKVTPSDINKYLQSFMKKLTSKVFRTMNASKLFQKELNRIVSKFKDTDTDDKVNLILDEFNKANAKVAILCNHQKSVSKNFKNSISKIKSKINELRRKRKELEKKKEHYKSKNNKKAAKKIRIRIKKINEKLIEYKSKKKLKIELKSVSLGTSKVNYIDPRITIAFMKRFNIDINKLFTKTLQQKFTWALDVDKDYKF